MTIEIPIQLCIPATREGRAAELKDLTQTLADIAEGQGDPLFAAFYEIVRPAVDSMEARLEALVLIAGIEEALDKANEATGTALNLVEVLRNRVADLHGTHEAINCQGESCAVCDDIVVATDLLSQFKAGVKFQ